MGFNSCSMFLNSCGLWILEYGLIIVVHGLSCSAACGIFLDQGSNLCPLHWQVDSYPVYHQGSPCLFVCLFLVALGLPCCRWAFSRYGKRGLLFFMVHGLLMWWLLLWRTGFSLWWFLLLWRTGSRHMSFSCCKWAQ